MPDTAEILTPGAETPTPETPETPAATAVPNYEEQARAKGWKPEKEFDGDPADWVDAEEFIKRGPLFEKIRNQGKQLTDLKKTIDAMAQHMQKTTKAAVDKAIADLKAQRREAIEVGDADKVEKIDAAIDEQKAIVIEQREAPAKELPEEIAAFIKVNPWFNTHPEMRAMAIAFQDTYLKNNPGMLKESLDETAKRIRRAFPEHFANDKRETPPAVEGADASRQPSSKGKYTVERLSADQRRVYAQIVTKHKTVSHDEFFKSLEEIGELK